MNMQPEAHQLDRTLMIAVGDIPAGDVQLGPVEGSSDDVLFPGGTVSSGRLQLVFDGFSAADQTLIDDAEADGDIGIAVDLKDADGNVIYGAVANGSFVNSTKTLTLPHALVFPTDVFDLGTAEITITDDLSLEGLALAWIQDR